MMTGGPAVNDKPRLLSIDSCQRVAWDDAPARTKRLLEVAKVKGRWLDSNDQPQVVSDIIVAMFFTVVVENDEDRDELTGEPVFDTIGGEDGAISVVFPLSDEAIVGMSDNPKVVCGTATTVTEFWPWMSTGSKGNAIRLLYLMALCPDRFRNQVKSTTS